MIWFLMDGLDSGIFFKVLHTQTHDKPTLFPSLNTKRDVGDPVNGDVVGHHNEWLAERSHASALCRQERDISH